MSSLSGRFNTWEVWSDFITMFACAISNAIDKIHFDTREKVYMNIIGKYNKTEQEKLLRLAGLITTALETDKNRDFLGELYMALELGNHRKGQFFTPYDICSVMARMNCGDLAEQIEKQGYISVADCCCGAGALLIAFANTAEQILKDSVYNWQNHILFCAQDVDTVTGLMCYIQLSLLGCPGYVKIGNSLTEPMTQGEAEYNLSASESNYWYTPIYFSDVWQYRRIWHSMDRFFNLPGTADEKKTDTTAGSSTRTDYNLELTVEDNGQMSLF